jgi:hypothetical protein
MRDIQKQTFTPGPWRPGILGGCVVANFPTSNPGSGHDAIDYYGGHLVAESIPPQNVNLISAAPEMFEALSNLENDDMSIPPAIWDMVQSALKKATGGDI